MVLGLQDIIRVKTSPPPPPHRMAPFLMENSVSVVVLDMRSRGHGFKPRLGIALCPQARHFIHCLVLVQPRKTRPNMSKN